MLGQVVGVPMPEWMLNCLRWLRATSLEAMLKGARGDVIRLPLSLLGLLAKIKCSICSYQFNIWYGAFIRCPLY